jgi:hypothetical protein
MWVDIAQHRSESAILAHFVSMRDFCVGWDEGEGVGGGWAGTKAREGQAKIIEYRLLSWLRERTGCSAGPVRAGCHNVTLARD